MKTVKEPCPELEMNVITPKNTLVDLIFDETSNGTKMFSTKIIEDAFNAKGSDLEMVVAHWCKNKSLAFCPLHDGGVDGYCITPVLRLIDLLRAESR